MDNGINNQTNTNNDKNFTPRCSAVEKDRRLRSVVQWIIEGQRSVDIVNNIALAWKLSEPQAKRYIKDARELLVTENQGELEDKKAFHNQIRLEQYRLLVQERKKLMTDTSIGYLDKIKALGTLAHQINMTARDMAKIDGVFVVKVDHTSKGEKIGSGTGVFELSITSEGAIAKDNVSGNTEDVDVKENEQVNE